MNYLELGRSLTVDLLRSLRDPPLDLLATAAFVAVADLALLVWNVESAVVGQAVGLPLLFFLPGYVLLAALFPGDGTGKARDAGRSIGVTRRGMTWPLRLAFSPVASVAVASPFGLALSGAGGLTRETAVASLSVALVTGAVVGAVRRRRVSPQRRYRVAARRRSLAVWRFLAGADSGLETAVNVSLAVAVVAAGASVGYALVAPQDGETYSNVELLTRNESTGEYVAEGFPTEFVVGEERSLTVAVTNGEGRPTEYTVVVELRRVRSEGEGLTVVESRVLDRLRRTVPAGETWYATHSVAPPFAGENLRLEYYLYRGDAPADPGPATADRHAYLWIDVAEA